VIVTVTDAVASLRPGAPFVIYGDELSGLVWQTEGIEPLTEAEVQSEIKRLESVAVQAAADAQAARQAAIDHAKSLGFTDAMISVMYPNLTMEA
jgi:hypothetical protein